MRPFTPGGVAMCITKPDLFNREEMLFLKFSVR